MLSLKVLLFTVAIFIELCCSVIKKQNTETLHVKLFYILNAIERLLR